MPALSVIPILLRSATLLISLLAASVLGGDGGLNRIRSANAAAAAAAAAWRRGDGPAAVAAYEYLATLGPLTEEARLNLAHAYFRTGRRGAARAAYAALSTSTVPTRRSMALSQLALLATAEQDYDRALTLLRMAVRADPASATARYNYEVLARWYSTGGDTPLPGLPAPGRRQQQPKRGQQAKPGQTQERPDGPATAPRGSGRQPGGGERPDEAGQQSREQARGSQGGTQRGESPEADPNRPMGATGRAGQGTEAADAATRHLQTAHARPPDDATLPTDQALMLLDAMRAAEEQYLQQLPHGSRRAANPTKPDW